MPAFAKLLGGLQKWFNQHKINDFTDVDVGFFGGQTYPDGTPVAEVAALNEYGHDNVPPRPFMRKFRDEHGDEWPIMLAEFMRRSNFNAGTSLSTMGEIMTEQLRQTIIDFDDPPLAASTIAAKGSSDPLIDSRLMLDSVGYRLTRG